jgi:hypothetical protein
MIPKSAEGRLQGVLYQIQICEGRFMFLFKFVKYAHQIDWRPIKGSFMFFIVICQKMSSKSAESQLKGVICFQFKFVKNASQIGRRPIKRSFMFLIQICLKMSLKSAEGRFKGALCL